MSYLVKLDIIRLFEKLPLLPMCQISKNLNAWAIVMVAAYSKKWEKIVRKRRNKTTSWGIHITKDYIDVTIYFPFPFEGFHLLTKQKLIEGEPFSKETQFYNLNFLKMLSQFFPPTSYRSISVSLGPRCPKFPFRFLSRLPRGTATYMHLEGDLEVNGPHLVKFLEKVQVKDCDPWDPNNLLDIKVRIKNFVMSDKILFENNNLSIRDARFLTRESTPKLGAFLAEIGVNNFTSQDLNAFLKLWMVDGRQNGLGNCVYTIDIREDQDIELEKVMEGLNVHDRRTRDRWHIHFLKNNDFLYLKATDMNGGLDITNSQGTLGTVLLEPNRFTFVTWMRGFTLESYEMEMRALIREYDNYISTNRKTLELLQNPNGRHNYSASQLQSKIRECHENIKQGKQNLARCCEIYQKLITEWSND